MSCLLIFKGDETGKRVQSKADGAHARLLVLSRH